MVVVVAVIGRRTRPDCEMRWRDAKERDLSYGIRDMNRVERRI